MVDAYNSTIGIDFEDQFSETVERLEQRRGKSILQSEIDALWSGAVDANDPTHVEDSAIRDLSTRAGRIGHVNEALSPQEEQPDSIAPLPEDASGKERAAFIDQRLAGAEVEAPDTEPGWTDE